MTRQQQKQITFFHHALWCLAKDLPHEDRVLAAKLTDMHHVVAEHLPKQTEEAYCHNVDAGGIITLYKINLYTQ